MWNALRPQVQILPRNQFLTPYTLGFTLNSSRRRQLPQKNAMNARLVIEAKTN
jgi:hypothetical protein